MKAKVFFGLWVFIVIADVIIVVTELSRGGWLYAILFTFLGFLATLEVQTRFQELRRAQRS